MSPGRSVLAVLADSVRPAMATYLLDDVEQKAREHLLDTCAAMVSGSELPPGASPAVTCGTRVRGELPPSLARAAAFP